MDVQAYRVAVRLALDDQITRNMMQVSRDAIELNKKFVEMAKNIKAVQRATGETFSHWPMKKWCAANGKSPKDVPDETYGTVKSWPAEAWKAVNDIDLKRIF